MVASDLSPDDPTYQRLIHQAPYIDLLALNGHQDGTVRTQIRHADRGEASSPSNDRAKSGWTRLSPAAAVATGATPAMR
jgi:hypothetical protein